MGFTDTMNEIRRGDIWYADVVMPGFGDIKKARPVVVISNDKCNANAPYVTVVPLTTQLRKLLPTHVVVPNGVETGLKAVSIAKAEDVMPVKKEDMLSCVGAASQNLMLDLEAAVMTQLGIGE